MNYAWATAGFPHKWTCIDYRRRSVVTAVATFKLILVVLIGCYFCEGVLFVYIYYSLSTGKYHESVASIVTSAVGTSDNVATDE